MKVFTDFRLVKIIEKGFFPQLRLSMGKATILSPSTFPLQIEIFTDFRLILLTLREIAKVLMIVDWQHVIRKRITVQSHPRIRLGINGLRPLVLIRPIFPMEVQTFLEIDDCLTFPCCLWS